MATYNKNVDYSDLIDKAVAAGNYAAAAQYEQLRNAKIKGEGMSYAPTNRFGGWLDKTDYGDIGLAQMAAGASKDAVRQTYNQRLAKASGTEGMSQYTNDDIMQQMLEYINAEDEPAAGGGGGMPSFDYSQYIANTPKPNYKEDFASKDPAPSFDVEDYKETTPQPSFESEYDSRIDDLLNEILSRDGFSYDVESDPLFQQYRTQYNREGSRAMNDTMAAAAANAGGMNSYAITAAQQANDYYRSQLGDKIPELYQMAYEMFLDDKASKVQDLGLLQEMDDTQYNRYRDTMTDWRDDLDFAYGAYRDDRGDYEWDTSFGYGQYRDAMSDWFNDRDFSYNQHRDEVGDYKWQTEFDYNAERDAIADERYEQGASGGGGGSVGGGAADSGEEPSVIETMLAKGNDNEARAYLLSLGLSQWATEAYMELYDNAKTEVPGTPGAAMNDAALGSHAQSISQRLATDYSLDSPEKKAQLIANAYTAGLITEDEGYYLMSLY